MEGQEWGRTPWDASCIDCTAQGPPRSRKRKGRESPGPIPLSASSDHAQAAS